MIEGEDGAQEVSGASGANRMCDLSPTDVFPYRRLLFPRPSLAIIARNVWQMVCTDGEASRGETISRRLEFDRSLSDGLRDFNIARLDSRTQVSDSPGIFP